MKKLFVVLSLFIFFVLGCEQTTPIEDNETLQNEDIFEVITETEVSTETEIDFSTDAELNDYIQKNIQQLDFKNDPYGNLLYVELGDVLIKFDAYNAKIINSNILIPYSYTLNDKWASSYVIYKILDDKKGGVLLSFDDYYNPNWHEILPLFDSYNIKATFFCFGSPKSRNGLKEFCFLAQAYGMQIGYHTLQHKVMTNMNKEEVYKNAVEPLQDFRDIGINLTAMSLPGGGVPVDEEALNALKKNFKLVRASGLGRVNLYYTPEEISNGFIYGASFDQLYFQTDESFRNMIKLRLIVAKMTNKIWPGFGHYFFEENEEMTDTRYTVKKENLKYMFETINTLKLESHLYEEYY